MQQLASVLLSQSKNHLCASFVAASVVYGCVHGAVWQGAAAEQQQLLATVHQHQPTQYPLLRWHIDLSSKAATSKGTSWKVTWGTETGSCFPSSEEDSKQVNSRCRRRQPLEVLRYSPVGFLQSHPADIQQQPAQLRTINSRHSTVRIQRCHSSRYSTAGQSVHPLASSRAYSCRAADTNGSHQYVLDPIHKFDTDLLLALQHTPPNPNGLVAAVALSGGVDSAVSALLLKLQGYEVFGVYMHNWDTADEAGAGKPVCTSAADLEDAKLVCHALKIPLYEADFVSKYWNSVFQQFLAGIEQGLTPNPDLACNSYIKFGALQQFAVDKGADLLATGHYARLAWTDTQDIPQQTYLHSSGPSVATTRGASAGGVSQQMAVLLKGSDPLKDQTYFLAGLHNTQLARALFPVGHLTKFEVKRIAVAAGLPDVLTAKRSSAGICFIGRRSFAQFLEDYIPPQPGLYVDVDSNKALGKCQNMLAVTVGQRAAGLGGQQTRVYVVGKNIANGTVYVAAGPDHPALYSSQALLVNANWIAGSPPAPLRSSSAVSGLVAPNSGSPATPTWLHPRQQQAQHVNLACKASGAADSSSVLPCEFKARYRQSARGCKVRVKQHSEDFSSSRLCALGSQFASSNGTAHGVQSRSDEELLTDALVAELQVPLRGLTPGQMFVMYGGDVCLGSAVISSHGPTKWELAQ